MSLLQVGFWKKNFYNALIWKSWTTFAPNDIFFKADIGFVRVWEVLCLILRKVCGLKNIKGCCISNHERIVKPARATKIKGGLKKYGTKPIFATTLLFAVLLQIWNTYHHPYRNVPHAISVSPYESCITLQSMSGFRINLTISITLIRTRYGNIGMHTECTNMDA